MEEIWDSGPTGRIIVNVIAGISFLVAAYLVYIAYKKVMNIIARGKVKELTVKYATVYDVNPPYAKGVVQFGFELPEKTELTFRIVNKKDEVVKELKSGVMEEGVHPVDFDTTEVEDGEYYYQYISEVQKTSKKFFIVNNR